MLHALDKTVHALALDTGTELEVVIAKWNRVSFPETITIGVLARRNPCG